MSDYASYEQGAQQTVVVQDPPQQEGGMEDNSVVSMIPMTIGGSSHDPFEFLDYQG